MRFNRPRSCLAVCIVAAILFSGCTTVLPETYPYSLAPEGQPDTFMRIRLLDSVGLRLKDATGVPVSELSGLAWDEDEQLLYAVSDEGMLHHLRLTVDGDRLREVRVVKSVALKKKNGKPLSGKKSDSEGLALVNGRNGQAGDSRLLISFEGKPRIVRYSPDGEHLGRIELPEKLSRKKNYRTGNKALESIILHPEYGMITAAEYPLRENDMKEQVLYAISGQEYHFRAAAAKNSAVTGLSILPNGNILVLERGWAGIQYPVVITLREVRMDQCDRNRQCGVRELAVISSADGWSPDNFEGLTRYRDNRYLMVSDDNESGLQSTVLVFFEVVPE